MRHLELPRNLALLQIHLWAASRPMHLEAVNFSSRPILSWRLASLADPLLNLACHRSLLLPRHMHPFVEEFFYFPHQLGCLHLEEMDQMPRAKAVPLNCFGHVLPIHEQVNHQRGLVMGVRARIGYHSTWRPNQRSLRSFESGPVCRLTISPSQVQHGSHRTHRQYQQSHFRWFNFLELRFDHCCGFLQSSPSSHLLGLAIPFDCFPPN